MFDGIIQRLTARFRVGQQRQQERIEQVLAQRAAIERLRRRRLERELATDARGWMDLTSGREDDD